MQRGRSPAKSTGPVSRVFERAPLTEAACEFRFSPASAWDWTVPGILYDRIKEQFPQKRQQHLVDVEVTFSQETAKPNVSRAPGMMQLLTEDGSAMVQLGPNLLAINQLQRYPGWDSFRTLILTQFDNYLDVAAPSSLVRLGLRYINRVEVPEHQVDLDKYFTVYPPVPPGGPQVYKRFLQQVELEASEDDTLKLSFGSVEGSPVSTFVLDLDFYRLGEWPIEAARDWIDLAHERVEQSFFACFTDAAHEDLFGRAT